MKTEKTEYCRITVYHKEKNMSAIFDSNGMYETLGDFRVHLLGRGNTIIAASTDAQFLDGNFDKTDYDEEQITCRAYHTGEPIKITYEVDGVTYHAVQVDDKIYIPDRAKTVTPESKEMNVNRAGDTGNKNAGNLYERYMRVKDENPGAIVFYRVGDFYEIFGSDAQTASTLLNLTLTSRDLTGGDGDADRVPMCGVPHHTVDGYVAKLTDWGFKAVIAG